MGLHDPNRLPENNPFTPPVAESLAVEPIDQLSQAESVRHSHIGHEKSIQAFGLLFFLGGIIAILLSTFLATALFSEINNGATNSAEKKAISLVMGLLGINALLGVLQIAVGHGLRKLNSLGKIGGTFFAAIGLFGFPIGTLFSAYLLYLLWSAKGQLVFSSQYRDIMKGTPHVVYKTSRIVWGILILFIAIITLAFVAIIIET